MKKASSNEIRNAIIDIDKELKILDNLPKDERLPYIEKLAIQRQPNIQNLLNDLVFLYNEKYGIEPSIINNASLKLSYAYFLMCYKYTKPSVHEKVNRYKMGSLMELLIIKEQIMIHPNSEKNQELNAIVGMSAAFSIINSMIQHDQSEGFYLDTRNVSIDDRIKIILINHRIWLETNGTWLENNMKKEMPVFINSQFHELLDIIAGASYEIH